MSALFGFTGPPDRKLAERMTALLRHRGNRSVDVDESPHATLGYLASAEETTEPHRSAGLLCLGEQCVGLAGQLTNPFSKSPLADILDHYREEGANSFSRLEGAFVLALRDRDTLYLVRDGVGVRTIYHGQHAGRLLFAIEPKGVWGVPGFPRQLRPGAIAQYLTFSFLPGADTMLEDLYELPAGHYLCAEGGTPPSLVRYFFFEKGEPEKEPPGDDKAWVEHFRDVFSQAVACRLPAGEPVGIFLSGGIDSSLVTAEVARQHTHRVKTFAIHFGTNYPNELVYARAVAERCRTDHEEVLIRPRNFLPRLRQMIWHLDDPIGDPITTPNFELSAHVSQQVRWVFNGEGGDPCLGGPKNLPMLLHHWYGGIDRDPHFREKLYLASYRRGYEEVNRLLTPEWQNQINPHRDLESILTPYFTCTHPKRFLDKLRAINIRLKLAHLILPKVDRMASCWGLIPLAPLCDEAIVRLSFGLPAHLVLAHGVEKVILKRVAEGMLPPEIIARPKSGMRVPVHFWFQGEMKRYAADILSPRRVRAAGIFNPERVQQLLAYDTEEGPGRYGLRLWMLLTFEIWRRLVVEGEAV